jgi:hypothetical protein
MKNSQLGVIFNRMSFTAYSHSLHQKKYEPSKLIYYTFSDELTPLGSRNAKTGVDYMPKRPAEVSQEEEWITHY